MAKSLLYSVSDTEFQKIIEESISLQEVSDKLGYQAKSGANYKRIKERIEELNLSIEHFHTKKGTKRTIENVFMENSTADQKTLRTWYIKGEYTAYECSICKLPPIWNNQPLTLILDHINGHNKDNRLENLRWVCPNCNQQLPTTNGKNIKRLKEESGQK